MGRLGPTAISLVLLVVAAGCGRDSERAGLPGRFPRDIPLPADAVVTDASEAETGLSVTLESSAPRQEITDFFRDRADDPPWHVSHAQDEVAVGASSLTFRNEDDSIVASVRVQRPAQATMTTIVIDVAFRTGASDATPAAAGNSPGAGG